MCCFVNKCICINKCSSRYSCITTCFTKYSCSVTRFGEISKLLQKFTSLCQILTVYFLFVKMISLLWQICDIIGLYFIVANGLILTNNLAIWSHCLYDRIDSPWTDKIKRFQINLSQKMVFFMMKLWVVWTHTSCHGGLVGTNCCPWLNLQTCFRHYLQTLESHKMWLSNKISHCKRS